MIWVEMYSMSKKTHVGEKYVLLCLTVCIKEEVWECYSSFRNTGVMFL
jgi:hypothetical protein